MEFKTTKKQGDWGLGKAIAYYTSLGYTVLLPLTDSQDYDLVVDDSFKLWKIQVKTTTSKKFNGYILKLSMRNTNKKNNTVKIYSKEHFDFLFIVTPDETYEIPMTKLSAKYQIYLSKKWSKFKLPNILSP